MKVLTLDGLSGQEYFAQPSTYNLEVQNKLAWGSRPLDPSYAGSSLGAFRGLGGLYGLGEAESTPAIVSDPMGTPAIQHQWSAMQIAWSAIGIAAVGASIYHGYKRNGGSVGWGLGWGLFGSALPIVAIPLALAQGFGKRAGR